MHNVTFDVDYAKAILLQLQCISEVPDLFSGLKDTLIFVACQSKTANLRSKSLKCISKMIKKRPENILDAKIKRVIVSRAHDLSVCTRESALDMLQQFFKGNNSREEDNKEEMIKKFTQMYLTLIIERAKDKSHLVRKKVI